MIPLFTVNIPKTVDKPLLEVLHSGYIGQGPKVDEFEQILSEYFKSNPVTVNSGTSALTLALRLAGVGYGDDVITTPMTCSATNLPILSLGANPVFADIHPESGNIDSASVAKLVTPKTKAIMCVDWGGTPPDLKALRAIADKHDIKLIEDSAHSFGADHTIDPIADFVCFSLQAIKHITTVDGGVLLCKTPEDAARGRRLRWFGIDRSGNTLDSRISEDIVEWGYKFHMNDVAAVIGIEQMKDLPGILRKHKDIAAVYRQQLSDFYGKSEPDSGAYWLYTLRLPDPLLVSPFKIYMKEHEIGVSQVHRSNIEYTAFKPFANYVFDGYTETPYEGLDQFASTMICIPIHNKLSNSDIQTIIDRCNDFAEANT